MTPTDITACVWGIKCVCCKTVFFHRQKVKTWLGTEVPITVRGNNRVEWRHTSQNKKKDPGRHSGVAGSVCECVCGRRVELRVLFGCLFTAGDGSQACKKMERRACSLTDRQAGRISVWWSVYLLSPPQQAQWNCICSGCTFWEKTSLWCEIDVSWGIVEQNAYFLINLGWLSVSIQNRGLKRSNLLRQASTVRIVGY